jgi:hypothetical protein
MMHRIIMKKRRYSLMLQLHFAFLHDLRVLTTHLIFAQFQSANTSKLFPTAIYATMSLIQALCEFGVSHLANER